MTTRVDVDLGIKGSNEESLFDASLDPITFIRQNGLVFFAKVVAMVASVLQHCRLILAKPLPKTPASLTNRGWSKANLSRSSSSIRSPSGLSLRDNRSELGIGTSNLNNDN